MHADDLILVTGATGNTGSTLVQELERRGTAVRATVRSSKDVARLPNTSAAVVVGNFDDPRSLEAALEGVTHAYLVTPSSPDAEAQQVRFSELAAAAGVRHLVNCPSSRRMRDPRFAFFAITRPSNGASASSASASHFSVPTCISRVFWRSNL
jgi:uncharacterized protein YbjT (DUF2867 family)